MRYRRALLILPTIVAGILAASCGGGDDTTDDQNQTPGEDAGLGGQAGNVNAGGTAGAAGKNTGGSAGGAGKNTGGAAGTAGQGGSGEGGTSQGGSSQGGASGEGGSSQGGASGEGGSSQGGASGEGGNAQGGAAGQGGSSGICTPGATAPCYSGPAGTIDVGICHGGTATCAADGMSWGACTGEVVPGTEDCATAQDENCDGQTPACNGPIVDLRADVNRNGTVDLTDPTEDANEDSWDAAHGAIFLANVDDDDKSCGTNGSDAQLAACNDASNTTIDGAADLEDLARIKTVPWPNAPSNASGLLTVDTASSSKVRLFKKSGANFAVYTPGTVLTAAELQAGVEFAIEAKDIIRDDAAWNGFTTLTFTVNPGSGPVQTDNVKMRVAPVLFRHHLDAPDVIYATTLNDGDSLAFRNDLSAAMTAAGVTKPLSLISVDDQWTQDFFETAYMSMPAVGGQKVIHVNFRSANYTSGKFRAAGKVVFTVLRGQDVAGLVQYDPNHDDNMDTLNSFGNLETVPPMPGYPMGRVIRGSSANWYPDPSFTKMLKAQGIDTTNTTGIQAPIDVSTEFLLVGHIDETLSFVKGNGTHGWRVLVSDTASGWKVLKDQCPTSSAANCKLTVFAGTSTQTTIGAIVGSTDIANANAWAITEIDAQKQQLKTATGVTDADFTPIPAVWWESYNYLVAYVPGIVNGISLQPTHFGPPDPHGPVVGGQDLFILKTNQSLDPIGITNHWIEDFELYHVLDGEVHCGSNTRRQIPATAAWWESGK